MAPVVLVAVLGYTHRWTSDDGFAYFRVVEQIQAGNGPVFNAGQRVETFASPLWLATLTIGDLIAPFDIAYVAAALSLAATVIGVLLATEASAHLLADGDRLRVPVGLLVVAVLWPTWIWSTGGAELGIAFGWVGACAWVLARWVTRPVRDTTVRAIGPAGLVVLGLGPLVRPDLTLFSTVLVVAVLAATPATPRRRLAMLLAAGALPLAYQVFRMGYYGLVTSSWSVGREDTAPRPGFGWDFFSDYSSAYLLVVPLVAVALAVYVPFFHRAAAQGERRRVVAVGAMIGGGVVNLLVVTVIAGGDSVHARALLPATMAVFAPAFVVPVTRRYLEAIVVVGVWAIGCGVYMRPGNVAALSLSGVDPSRGLTLDDTGFGGDPDWITGPGLYIADPFEATGTRVPIELADPDAVVVATRSMGIVGQSLGTDVTVLDLNGVGDPLTGHQSLEYRYLAGQEKSTYSPWLVARLAADPGVVQPAALPDARPFHDPTLPLQYLEDVAWAEATLECGPLLRLLDAYDGDLTATGFFRNIWRSMSNTSLRYPTEPRSAYFEEGCGGLTPEDRLSMRGPTPDAVQEFYDRVETGPVLPSDPDDGAVAVSGRCEVTLLPSGDQHEPWTPVHAASFRASVTFDENVTSEPLTAVWVLGPFGRDRGVVWLQADGNGNFRISQEINWFPQVTSEWQPIDPRSPVQLQITADLDTRQWVVTVDGVPVAESPMLSQPADRPGVVVAVPQRAAPGHSSSSIVVAHETPMLDRACQAILAANAEPGPVRPPRNGLPVPTAT